MKKGNFFPRTRARWQTAEVPAGGPNCPTWLRISNQYAVYIYNDDGVPTPRVLTQTGTQPARWNYEPDTGSIIWFGTWDDGLFHGNWKVSQRFSQTYHSWLEFSLSRTFIGPAEFISYETQPSVQSGIWSHVNDLEALLNTNTEHSTTWLFWLYAFYHPMTYAEIRAIGEDPDDCSPLTWDYSS